MASRTATFTPLAAGDEPRFTSGHSTMINLLERPMWVSYEALPHEGVKINLTDGDSAGQTITLAKSWLDGFSVVTPRVFHENGDLLEVVDVDDNLWEVHVPHFSSIIILPDWKIDLETGVEWREAADSELDTLGYPAGASGWISKNYGSLEDFGTAARVNLQFAFRGEVEEVEFILTDTIATISGLTLILPLGSVVDPVPQQWTADEDRHYDALEGWSAISVDEQFKGSLHGEDGSLGLLYGARDELDIDGDYALAIFLECEQWVDLAFDDCRDILQVAGDVGTVEMAFAYLGEVEWCESNVQNWKAEMADYFAKIEEIFSTQTKAKLVLSWRTCTIVHPDETASYDHDSANWIYVHEDSNAPVHPWPFNNVHDHRQDDDTGYLATKIVVGDQEYADTYKDSSGNSVKGVKAYVAHAISDAESDGTDLVWPDLAQMFHSPCFNGDSWCGGRADDIPGMVSIISEGVSKGLAAHEVGHTIDGDHCAAAHLGSGEFTLMRSTSSSEITRCNYETTPTSRSTTISSENRNRMNEHVGP